MISSLICRRRRLSSSSASSVWGSTRVSTRWMVAVQLVVLVGEPREAVVAGLELVNPVALVGKVCRRGRWERCSSPASPCRGALATSTPPPSFRFRNMDLSWPPISTRSAFRSMSASAAAAGRCGGPISSRSPPAASTATAAGPLAPPLRCGARRSARSMRCTAVIAFFEERRGRLYGFRFRDRTDWRSGPPSREPTPLDQRIGTGDGATPELPARERPTARLRALSAGHRQARGRHACGSRSTASSRLWARRSPAIPRPAS